jgi:hypothetical protein
MLNVIFINIIKWTDLQLEIIIINNNNNNNNNNSSKNNNDISKNNKIEIIIKIEIVM